MRVFITLDFILACLWYIIVRGHACKSSFINMKTLQVVVFVLLLNFQTRLAYQPQCFTTTASICVQRSTVSNQNIVTLVCNLGDGWRGAEYFKIEGSGGRIVSRDYPTEMEGRLLYMVLTVSVETEGTYICRDNASSNSRSTNNVTLFGKRFPPSP